MYDCCSVNYEDDRDYDYLIERLNHIEEEIKFIKKILEHKRVKEEAWEQLKQEAEYERIKEAGGNKCVCNCDDDIDADVDEEDDVNPEVKELIKEIIDKLEKKPRDVTYTYTIPYRKDWYPPYIVGDKWPYSRTAWF